MVFGWREFGTFGGVFFSIIVVSGLFSLDWLIDKYVYSL